MITAEYWRHRGAITLEGAVRKMAGWPAQRMGRTDRGLIRERMRADVLVFDPARVQDNATYQQPLLVATGIDDVIVNGKLTIDEGRMTEVRAGLVLRHGCGGP